MNFVVAARAFVAALFHSEVSQMFQDILDGSMVGTAQLPRADHRAETDKDSRGDLKPDANETRSNGRSESLELLSALQRDARFLDFIKEDLSSLDDSTIGAAARVVHDHCADTLERFFEIRPLSTNPEGSVVEGNSLMENPSRYRFVGGKNRSDFGSFRVARAGWVARKCDLPQWSGKKEDSFVLSPIELEKE